MSVEYKIRVPIERLEEHIIFLLGQNSGTAGELYRMCTEEVRYDRFRRALADMTRRGLLRTESIRGRKVNAGKNGNAYCLNH